MNRPLDGPLHGSVGDDKRRGEVEHLSNESSRGVEYGCVENAGKGSLSIGAESV